MFNLFKKTLGFKTYLGVDIGTTSIKIVEVEGNKGSRPNLKNYGTLEGLGYLNRANDAIQTSSLKMLDTEVIALLRALLKNINTKTTDVIASLPSFLAFTTLLDMPVIAPAEMAKAIHYQAQALVPLPSTEVTVDWITASEYIDDAGVKHQQIFLIAVPNEVIANYKRIFSAVGLNLLALEVEGLSLARVLAADNVAPALIIDIGGRSTSISIAANGTLRHLSQIDFAGGSLTQAIATGLNINPRRAEELKKQRGLTGTGGEYELATLMGPFLDGMISEAKRIKTEFDKNSKTSQIDRVILSGGGANLKGIEEYFSREFQLPTAKADPTAKINFPAKIAPIAKNIGSVFTVALGLSIREF